MVKITTQDDFKNSFREHYLNEMPLMGSPLYIATILLCYLLFVLKVGPNYMKSRPAYNLNNFLIGYNAVQVAISIYLFSIAFNLLWQHGIFDQSCTSQSKGFYDKLLYAGYCYFLAKVSELLDTIFFILRKKQNQVTFLHIYHHSVMVVTVWGYLKYESSHSSAFLGTVNSFIHIVMYGYYLLAAVPGMSKYLWWKKYLTTMQLIQFALIFIHTFAYPWMSSCPPSNALFIIIAINAVFFIYLFTKFYIQCYTENTHKFNLDNFVCSNSNQNHDSYDVELVKNNEQGEIGSKKVK